MVVKTFRGLLADGGQDLIRLSTIKGKVGYRIIKFELMGYKPGDGSEGSYECIAKVTKTSITTPDGTVDFTDTDLLAVGLCFSNTAPHYSEQIYTIFDNEIFNQDIFISQIDVDATRSVNYYLELELIPLEDSGAAYTTLKDMRQRGV